MVTFAAIFGFCTLLLLGEFFKLSSETVNFYNRYNGQLVVSFWNNNPDKHSFQEFINEFKESIEKTIDGLAINNKKSIAEEINDLNDLKEKEILTQEEFEMAKKKILNSIDNKKIGFDTENHGF